MTAAPLPARDWALLRPTPVPGVSLLRAQVVTHAFERHSHETYAMGLTYSGAQSFRCRGANNTSHGGNLIAFNPDEAHDGHAQDPAGFAYAIFYLPAALLSEWMGQGRADACVACFRQPVIEDAGCAGALARAVEAVQCPGESLRAGALIQAAALRLAARHGGARPGAAPDRRTAAWLRRVRDCMEAQYASDLSVEQLAAQAGVSRTHLTRSFTAVHGVPPHVHLNALRLRAAQRLLLAGHSLADAAAASGFVDQSHFTRRFRGSVGLTPSAWVRAMRQPRGAG